MQLKSVYFGKLVMINVLNYYVMPSHTYVYTSLFP